MTKYYYYKIEGRDGEGDEFGVGGWAHCEYAEVWDKINRDAVQRLLSGGASCPFVIEHVSVTLHKHQEPEARAQDEPTNN